jgi:hypothetical protein
VEGGATKLLDGLRKVAARKPDQPEQVHRAGFARGYAQDVLAERLRLAQPAGGATDAREPDRGEAAMGAARRLSTSPWGLDESGRNQMLAVAIAARDSIGAVQLNSLLPQCF